MQVSGKSGEIRLKRIPPIGPALAVKSMNSHQVFRFEEYLLDLTRGCLRTEDRDIELRPKTFELLRYLVENNGRLVSKDEIFGTVWPNVIVTDDSIKRCVNELRVALGDSEQRIIKTVPRRGYLFASAVLASAIEVGAAPAAPGPAVSKRVAWSLPRRGCSRCL